MMEPTDIRDLLIELEQLGTRGEFEAVAQRVEEVLDREPESPSLNLQLSAPLIDAGVGLDRIDLTRRGIHLLEAGRQALEEAGKLPPQHEVQARYNLSNGYAHLVTYYENCGAPQDVRDAETERRHHLHFAAAACLIEETEVHPETFQRTLVNYAVLLNANGRYVEAADYCVDCLRRFPDNPMAQGTLGNALLKLARLDSSHTAYHFAVAWSMLRSAVQNPDGLMRLTGSSDVPDFQLSLDWLEGRIDERKSHSADVADWVEHVLYGHDPEDPPAEVAKWGDDRLLLTFGPATYSCRERFRDDAFAKPLKLPDDHQTPDEASKLLLDGLNSAKEEFATARHIYYAALRPQNGLDETTKRVSFATGFAPDRAHGLHVGMLKAAFRLAHDVLDKGAYCLALYSDLDKNLERVNFANVWIGAGQKSANGPPLNPTLEEAAQENNYLRALRDLAEDWYENRFPGPVKAYRDAATHRGLCVADSLVGLTADSEAAASLHQFERRTFLMLRLAKSAVLYLMATLIEQSYLDVPELNEADCLDFEMAYRVPVSHES